MHVHVIFLCRRGSRPRRSISGIGRLQLDFQTFQSFVPHGEESVPSPFGFGPDNGIVPSVGDQKSRTIFSRVQEKGLGDPLTYQKLRFNTLCGPSPGRSHSHILQRTKSPFFQLYSAGGIFHPTKVHVEAFHLAPYPQIFSGLFQPPFSQAGTSAKCRCMGLALDDPQSLQHLP